MRSMVERAARYPAPRGGLMIRPWAATDVIYVIMRGIDVPGGTEMEVLGDDRKVIATGLDAALKAWKACVDGL